MKKIGIIICGRYKACGGGKCLRALRERVGAFARYEKDEPVEVVGYSYCGDCPGGNVEYVPEEMKKNGAEVIHLATGLIVGYPPCPYIDTFRDFMQHRYGVKVVLGTHPIPRKYLELHTKLGTWEDPSWNERLAPTMADEATRVAYD